MSSDRSLEAPTRALAPHVGTVVLLAITVLLAATVAVGLGLGLGLTGDGLLEFGPDAAFDLEADADRSELTLEHRGGDPIDVEDLELRIAVDGDDLAHQPPVPFVGAEGFRGAPSGPFNPETDSEWRAEETARLRIAETNDPGVRSGDTVTVTIVVDGNRVAHLEATAG